MAVSTRKAENVERKVTEKSDMTVSVTAANQDVHVRTNSYVLNKVQALKKKLQQCVNKSILPMK